MIAEVIIVLYLYGFPRFVAELHIMSKRKLPAIFQIQIRYIVLPVVGVSQVLYSGCPAVHIAVCEFIKIMKLKLSCGLPSIDLHCTIVCESVRDSEFTRRKK